MITPFGQVFFNPVKRCKKTGMKEWRIGFGLATSETGARNTVFKQPQVILHPIFEIFFVFVLFILS